MARPRKDIPPAKPPIRKVPMVAGKALPGRPRKDGLPPIQRAAAAAMAALPPEEAARRAVAAASHRLLGRIKYLAGRGLPPKYIASLVNRDFKEAKVVAGDFEPLGKYHEVAIEGKAEAVLEVADGMFDRAKSPTGKGVDPLFWLKCNGDWAETPAGRVKAKAADEDDTVVGMDITVTD